MWEKHSSFFETLTEEKDREQYNIKKLTLQNGQLLSDPFNIDDREWSSDVKFLPDITYLDIWSYLIDTPSDFTKDKLKAYKSLEAYNFFVSRHVQDVSIHNIKESCFSFVKTSVLPSQRPRSKTTIVSSLASSAWKRMDPQCKLYLHGRVRK